MKNLTTIDNIIEFNDYISFGYTTDDNTLISMEDILFQNTHTHAYSLLHIVSVSQNLQVNNVQFINNHGTLLNAYPPTRTTLVNSLAITMNQISIENNFNELGPLIRIY